MGSQSSRVAVEAEAIPDSQLIEQEMPDAEEEVKAGSPHGSGDKIVVRPRATNTTIDATPDATAQQPSKKRRRTESPEIAEDATNDRPKKKKSRKSRGRPRDPSQLKREVAVEAATVENNAQEEVEGEGLHNGKATDVVGDLALSVDGAAEKPGNIDGSADGMSIDARLGLGGLYPGSAVRAQAEVGAIAGESAELSVKKRKKRVKRREDETVLQFSDYALDQVSTQPEHPSNGPAIVDGSTEAAIVPAVDEDPQLVAATIEDAPMEDAATAQDVEAVEKPKKRKKKRKSTAVEEPVKPEPVVLASAELQETEGREEEAVISMDAEIATAAQPAQGASEDQLSDSHAQPPSTKKRKKTKRRKSKVEMQMKVEPDIDEQPSQAPSWVPKPCPEVDAKPVSTLDVDTNMLEAAADIFMDDVVAGGADIEAHPVNGTGKKTKKRKRKSKARSTHDEPLAEELQDSADDEPTNNGVANGVIDRHTDQDVDVSMVEHPETTIGEPLAHAQDEETAGTADGLMAEPDEAGVALSPLHEALANEEPSEMVEAVVEEKKKRKKLRKSRRDAGDTTPEERVDDPSSLRLTDSQKAQPHQATVPSIEEVVAAPAQAEQTQPSTRKRKRKQVPAADEDGSVHDDLDGVVSSVSSPPTSHGRNQPSLPAPVTPSTPPSDDDMDGHVSESSEMSEDAQATRNSPIHTSDALKVGGSWFHECESPCNINTRTHAHDDVVQEVIGEAQWALDKFLRIQAEKISRLDGAFMASPRALETLRNIGDNFHQALAKDEQALSCVWNVANAKYLHMQLPDRGFTSGAMWRRLYLHYTTGLTTQRETAAEQRERLDRAQESRKAFLAAPVDSHDLYEQAFKDYLAQLARRSCEDAVNAAPAGPQATTRPRSKEALDSFINSWIDTDVAMLDPNQPSARRPGAVDAMEGILEDDDEDSAGSVIPESAAPEVRKGKRRMSLDVDPSRPTPLPEPVDGPSSGAFTNDEKAAMDAVLEHYCQLYHLDSDEQRSNMMDWKKLDPELRDYLIGCLPNRKKVAVRKFCQRRYIPKTEGAWTAEEDALLLEWHTVYGAKWAEIADHVHGRMPSQCQDRYRDHLQYAGKAQTGAWSQDEESMLVKVVAESIEQIRRANIDNGDLVNEAEDLEKLVPWNVVSDKMGGTRTRKRCLEKWHNLRKRNPTLLNNLADADPPAPTATALVPIPETKNQRLVAKKFETFENGDVHDVLCEIHTAIADHTKTYSAETTVWSIVGQAAKDSRFNAKLRRLAYHEALNTYGTKKSVRAALTIAAKAKAMAEWMEGYNTRHNEEFVRGYVPPPVMKKPKKNKKKPSDSVDESDDEEEGAPARKRRKARERMIAAGKVDEQCAEVADVLQREPRSLLTSKSRRLQLSTEMVENSDDDEEDVEVKNASVSDATKPEFSDTDSSSSESGSHDESDRSVDDRFRNSPPASLDLPSSPPASALPADDPPVYNDAVATNVDEAQDEHGDPFDVVSMSSMNSRIPLVGRKRFLARCKTVGRQ
ncbi:hypothetical protein LTS10_005444 [Elasticomyces elasticus]|nr:hypothetical protein LTS10_005444 [Elasticomyces elasticus]